MPEDNMGGSYVINEAGEKVLVSRTDGMPEPAPAVVPGKKPKPAAAQSIAPAADIENPTGGNQ